MGCVDSCKCSLFSPSFSFPSSLFLVAPLFSPFPSNTDRQMDSIREFCPLDMPIFMFDKDGKYVVKTLEDLLPMSFGPKDLKGKGNLEVMQAGGGMEREVAP